MFFAHAAADQASRAMLSDLNPHLVNLFRAVRARPQEVIAELRLHALLDSDVHFAAALARLNAWRAPSAMEIQNGLHAAVLQDLPQPPNALFPVGIPGATDDPDNAGSLAALNRQAAVNPQGLPGPASVALGAGASDCAGATNRRGKLDLSGAPGVTGSANVSIPPHSHDSTDRLDVPNLPAPSAAARAPLARGTPVAAADSAAAADTLYLLASAFHSCWHEARDGHMTMTRRLGARPFAARPRELVRAAALLQRAEIGRADFRAALSRVAPGDLVFLDPPYLDDDTHGDPQAYTAMRFTRRDLAELSTAMTHLVAQGSHVVFCWSA
jgi:hypothetical protein